LLNRWILDPGLDVHIANSKAFGWTPYQPDLRTPQFLRAGGQQVKVEEWGSVIVYGRASDGTLVPWQLNSVAYAPTFFTNIVGLFRCWDNDIHFDSGRKVLYQSKPSNVIVNLEFTGNHWLFDQEPADRPSLTQYASFATQSKPSEAPKKPLRVTKAEAH
ncbi:hypothetical protein EJ04DRAFT_402950, partial [Polyplosphaeria fusca]